MDNCYVYLHIKADNGQPFYVGKGKSRRAYYIYNRSKWWNATVSKHGFDVIILESNLNNEEAIKKEMYWIKRIGRRDLGFGPLVNLTDGGEGILGAKLSEEHKQILINSNKTRIISFETKLKHKNNASGENNYFYGKKRPEHSKFISKIQTGRKLSEETKKKIGESNRIKVNRIKKFGSNNPSSKLLLDIYTGIFFESIKEASLCYNIKSDTLASILRRKNRKKYTNLILV